MCCCSYHINTAKLNRTLGTSQMSKLTKDIFVNACLSTSMATLDLGTFHIDDENSDDVRSQPPSHYPPVTQRLHCVGRTSSSVQPILPGLPVLWHDRATARV